MITEKWSRNFRLALGLVLAPMVVPLVLYVSLRLALARLGPDQTYFTPAGLHLFVLVVGAGPVYLGVLCLGIPYLLLLRRAGRLSFRTIMLPALMLSWVYSVVVYTSLQRDYPFAGTVAGLCVSGVLLAGLLFHFLVLWRAPEEEEISLLLDAYPNDHKPTVQV
jgi:hypothetical protein